MPGMTVKQPGREHFDWATYLAKPRWNSFWHQIDETLAAKPETCLIIGSGDGIVADILRARGVAVTTCDIVDDLAPDVVADVRDLPFPADSFDVTICCQVLEHIEWDTVPAALGQLARVTRARVVLSVPDQGRFIDLAVNVGRGRRFFRRVAVPGAKDWAFNGVHYWELGAAQTPVHRFRDLLWGPFHTLSEYRVRENSYHRFFVLKVR